MGKPVTNGPDAYLLCVNRWLEMRAAGHVHGGDSLIIADKGKARLEELLESGAEVEPKFWLSFVRLMVTDYGARIGSLH